jgi:uncharacterized 2Fe-2S/4Fe-4S cluster protein (DUF4445 family)
MAGVEGAIHTVYVSDGTLRYTVISGGTPKGICGSGIIDAISVFLDIGMIDETGRIVGKDQLPEELHKYLTEEDAIPAIRITYDIVITQKDIREIQTAKAAIAAGVLTLLHEADVDIRYVSCIYLAGGFGNYMNPENALKIGLIPKAAKGKIRAIGNAAGAGAIMTLCHEKYRQTCRTGQQSLFHGSIHRKHAV